MLLLSELVRRCPPRQWRSGWPSRKTRWTSKSSTRCELYTSSAVLSTPSSRAPFPRKKIASATAPSHSGPTVADRHHADDEQEHRHVDQQDRVAELVMAPQ